MQMMEPLQRKFIIPNSILFVAGLKDRANSVEYTSGLLPLEYLPAQPMASARGCAKLSLSPEEITVA
jgi:hypothetical protein